MSHVFYFGIAIIFVCSWNIAILQAGTSAKHTNVIKKQASVDISNIKEIGGFVGQRLDANLNGNIKVFDIDKYVRMVEDKSHTGWWWIGEQPGKWLESAVWNSARTDDSGLIQRTQQVLSRLVDAQEPQGYLGITSPNLRTPEKPLRGMDPYELYFMMHGLLTAHEQFKSQAALTCASRLGDYFVNNIGPGKAEFYPSRLRYPANVGKHVGGQSEIAGHGVHYGWEGTLLIDPMLRLYQVTGEKTYLDWGKWVIDNIDKWSGWDSFSKLEKVASGDMGIHEVQPYVHSHTFQMNFLGFLRMYQITGETSYLRKVQGVWEDIVERQMYITGGVSVAEHYEAGYIKPISGNSVETCANMSWLELNQALLELTGDTRYADVIERLLFNHIFAAQVIDGECNRYHTAPNGVKPQHCFHGPDCCTASGHRQISMLPSILFAKDRHSVYINQYVPAKVTVNLEKKGELKFRLVTRYPETDRVVIHIDSAPTGECALKMRIPTWCTQPAGWINNRKVSDVKQDAYMVLTRKWNKGDTVELQFPMKTQWVKRQHHTASKISRLKAGGWEQMHQEVEEAAPFALKRGPVLYAFDTVWWNYPSLSPPRNAGDEIAVDRSAGLQYKILPAPPRTLGPAIEVPLVRVGKGTFNATMLPFANIGTWYQDGKEKPDRNSDAFSYATWLFDVDHPRFAALIKQKEAQRNAVDYIELGQTESEEAHQLSGGSGGEFKGRAFRHARYPDQIRCQVKVLPETPCDLVCTWWGSDMDRVFDLYANDQKIATVTLQNKHPNVFYEERFRIPLGLIKGKTDSFGQKVDQVELRFVPHASSTAGGLFGLRIIRAKI